MSINYSVPTDQMGRLLITFDATEVLYGITTGFRIAAPGEHIVFPYATTSTTYNTSSAEIPSPGVLSFSGVMASKVATVKTTWLNQLGDIQASVVLRIQAQNVSTSAYADLFNATLWGFRFAQTEWTPKLYGHYLLIHGKFLCTFRKIVNT